MSRVTRRRERGVLRVLCTWGGWDAAGEERTISSATGKEGVNHAKGSTTDAGQARNSEQKQISRQKQTTRQAQTTKRDRIVMKLADIDVLVTFIKVWGSESTG